MTASSFREIFGIDLRTLALFRVLLGSFIVFDLVLRARDLSAHYTDFGVMPRAVAMEYLRVSSYSLHLANGSAWFQLLLFGIAAVVGIMLIAGWHTRIATIASWVLLLSLQNRNTVILSGEDNLFILLLFWAMFLPLGSRWSLDAQRERRNGALSNDYFSIASMALLLQGMSMYFFSALLKSDDRWFPDGTAVYYALQLDYFVTPFGLWFRQFESLLIGLTHYVHLLEFIGPILIFSPVFFRPLRSVLMVAFITMHIGLFLCLEIGAFPLISIIMNLIFLPGWVWDNLGAWFRRQRFSDSIVEAVQGVGRRFTRLADTNDRQAYKQIQPSIFSSVFAGFMLLFVTIQNVSTLPALGIELRPAFINARQLLGVYQNWTMFAPYPELTSPWPVISGQLVDGTSVDVYNNVQRAPSFEKPEIVSAVYKNYRWRKYLSNMEDNSYERVPQRLAFNYGRYLCRQWNTQYIGEKRLLSFELYFMVERTPELGKQKLAEQRHVWSWNCFDGRN